MKCYQLHSKVLTLVFERSFFFLFLMIGGFIFSQEPRLYKRVCPSVGPSVGQSVGPSVGNAFVSAGRDEPANDLFRVYKLVFS